MSKVGMMEVMIDTEISICHYISRVEPNHAPVATG